MSSWKQLGTRGGTRRDPIPRLQVCWWARGATLGRPFFPRRLVQTPVSGWLEAFAAHPRIGDIVGLRAKYGGGGGDAAFAAMSSSEQAGAAAASDAVLQVFGKGACGCVPDYMTAWQLC